MSVLARKLAAQASWVIYLSAIVTLSGGCASTVKSVARDVGQDLGQGVEQAMARAFGKIEPIIEDVGKSLAVGVEHAMDRAFEKLETVFVNNARRIAEHQQKVAEYQMRDRRVEELEFLVHTQQAALTKGEIQIEALKEIQEQLPRIWTRISENKRQDDQDRIASIKNLEARLRAGTRDTLFLIGALVAVSTLVVTVLSASRRGREGNAGGLARRAPAQKG